MPVTECAKNPLSANFDTEPVANPCVGSTEGFCPNPTVPSNDFVPFLVPVSDLILDSVSAIVNKPLKLVTYIDFTFLRLLLLYKFLNLSTTRRIYGN